VPAPLSGWPNAKPYADSWLAKLRGRRHQNVAAVALANKNARIVWALLTQDREYQADFGLAA
jgi:transposase